MALRISTDTHIIIIAQDSATYKVMDLFDARCKDLIDGRDVGADLDLDPSCGCNGHESNGYPTRGRAGIPSSPTEPVCQRPAQCMVHQGISV